MDEFSMEVVKVIVTDCIGGTFHARTTIKSNGITREVDMRTSDSIALALRTGAPIFVAKSVLSERSVEEIPAYIHNKRIISRLPEPRSVRLIFHRRT